MKKILLLIYILLCFVFVHGQSTSETVFENADFTIEAIDLLNDAGSDISPFFVGDKLYFSSVPEEFYDKKRLERRSKAFYSMYSANLTKEGIISSSRDLLSGFGADYHEGPGDYCTATGEMFISISNTNKPDSIRKMISEEDIKLSLGIMKQDEGIWRLVENLWFCDQRFNYAHPSINSRGDTLLFTSDMDSLSYGKSDIFMSTRNSGVWSAPKNLGSKINTDGRESFPRFIGEGLLCFSSDSHPDNYGGLDLYYTDFPSFNKLVNLGKEINSESDDFSLVVHPNKKLAYYSSNRIGKGSDDLYRIDIHPHTVMFRGLVVDDATSLPIANSTVALLACDGKQEQSVNTDSQGAFAVQVIKRNCPVLQASKQGYITASKDIKELRTTEIRLQAMRQLLVLDILDKHRIQGATITCDNQVLYTTDSMGLTVLDSSTTRDCKLLVSKDSYLNQSFDLSEKKFGIDTVYLLVAEVGKEFAIKNIYYDFDKWDILPASEVALNKLIELMKYNPSLQIELSSHTDSRGSWLHNKKLSIKRSNAVFAYLTRYGISASRLKAKGYGERFLVNRCANGVKCPAWMHRQNRRTEIKVIGLGI